MRSAVILPVDLPGPLEAYRQRHVADAPMGLPAHVTLRYPFVPAEALTAAHVERLERSVAGSPAFEYRLASVERWPDTLYVAPQPTAPFDELAARLAAAWPEWPLYGDGSPFEAHVTLGEPADAPEETALRLAAGACLPAGRAATTVLLVVEGADGRWETRRTLTLG